METAITFLSDGLPLEGLLLRQQGDRAVIITHPHSLYGGDMYNPVVDQIRRVYHKKGFSTLRFNFRGVGGSSGVFDNGCGEGNDVFAAVRYLIQSGFSTIHLAGYSFGARVLAGLADLPPQIETQVFVAPPVAFMDFSGIAGVKSLKLVIAGDLDDIAPADEIADLIALWNPEAELKILKGCDHFFSTAMNQLEVSLQAFIT